MIIVRSSYGVIFLVRLLALRGRWLFTATLSFACREAAQTEGGKLRSRGKWENCARVSRDIGGRGLAHRKAADELLVHVSTRSRSDEALGIAIATCKNVRGESPKIGDDYYRSAGNGKETTLAIAQP